VALAGGYGFVVLGLTDSVIGVAWPSIARTFSLPPSRLSVLLFASGLGYLLTAIPSGRLLNRFGAPLTMAVASIAAGAACAVYAASPVFALLPAASLLLGAASGSVDAGLNTVVASGHSARVLNFIHGAYGVGTVIGPILVTTAIAASGSWRLPYLVLIAAEIACSASWWAVRQAIDDSQPEQAVIRRDSAAGRREGVLSGDFPERLLVMAAVALPFIYVGAELSAGQWAASYLRDHLHVSAASAGLAVAGYWAAYAIVRLLMAAPTRPPSARVLIPVGCAVGLAGAFVIWLVPTQVGTVLGLIIVGAGLAPVFPALIGLTPARLGQAQARHVIGWQMAAAGAGGLAIAALTGVLLGQFGFSAFGPVLVALLIVVLASNFLMDFLAAQHRAHVGSARAR
jgi:fucose permease